MATRMQQRKGTAAQWISTNSGNGPVLNAGEIGFELDTNKFKIGDGVNHWVDLVYFTDSASALAAINSVIDAAPAALNTLNELAAAINDDPAFFTTIATNLSNHQSDTTNIHGIADTSLLATTDNVATAKSEAISTAASDATTKANAAQAAAEATASADATSKATIARDTAITAANNYTDSSVASLIDSAPGALNTLNELAAAINDDASYAAGITTALATKANISYVDEEITDALNTAGGNLSSHASDTTGIHGIADTAQLATQSLVSDSIATAIAPLSTTAYVDQEISDAVAPLATTSYVNAEISDAVTGLATESFVGTSINTATASLASIGYVDEAVGNVTDAQAALAGDGISWNLNTDQYDVDNTVARTSDLNDHINDTLGVHGIADTSVLATTTYVDDQNNIVRDDAAIAAASLLTGATKTNITITGDKNGLTITAENGVADSTTDNLSEGLNNKYFTDERAQDAIGNSVGTGLSYNDATGVVSVDTAVIQARVTNISDTEIGYLDGLSSNIQSQIDTKAALVSPTFTGTVSGITKSMVGLGDVDNTSDANKPVSTAQATAIALAKSEAIADATAQVSAVIDGAPAALNTLNELAAAINDDASYAATITASLATKAPLESPTFTGTVSGVTKSMVGLANVDNTSDVNKPVSSATQTALDAKLASSTAASTYAPLVSPTFTGTVTLPTGTVTSGMILDGTITNADINGSAAIALSKLATDPLARANHTGTQTASTISDFNEAAQDAVGTILGSGLTYTDASDTITVDSSIVQLRVANVSDAEIGYLDGVTSAIQTQINAKSPSANPTFTGTVVLPSTTSIGTVSATEIGYVDGVTSSIQTQIDTKAPIASPTFTGTVAGITKSMVGLGNVDNTSDANKPVSSATQTALDAKLALAGGTMTGALTLSGAPTSDLHAATKLYVDNVSAGINFHEAVHVATTANLSAVYNNGTNGVGATLTASANGAWSTIDGHTSFTQYDRVLVKDQTDTKQNGIYILSDLGGATSKWILTRATDADNNPSGEMEKGDFVLVLNGTTNASYGFINNSTANPIAIGTDAITYSAFNAAKTIAAGNGLQEETPGILSIDTSITQTRVSGVSDTEIGYLDGVTSSIQTQIDSKLATATASSTYAPLASPTFTGTVTLPTGTVTSGMILDGTIVDGDINASAAIAQSKISGLTSDLALKAPLASPTFTGAPLSTTAAADTNTTQIATTAYVVGQASSATPVMNGTAAVGTSLKYARADHVHASDTAKANLAGPTFTGTVTLPSTTSIGLVSATEIGYLDGVTSAVQTQLDAKLASATAATTYAPLASPTFTGTVTLPTGTVTSGMILDGTIVNDDISATAAIAQSKISGLSTSLGLKADLASPTFTGVPLAPTAAAGTNTTQVATTAFVGTAVADLVASAPSALNTLNELATALGNDASFSTTVTNSLAAKAPLASPTFTGTATIPTLTLTNPLTAANGGTGLSSLGTGVATFLGTPSSANFASMLTDEIGTGSVVLSEIATSAQTASYTLVAADRGKLVEMNVGSANNLTVPLNSSVPFPVGTQIDILQVGSGQTTIVATGGVTVNGTPGLKIRAQWGGATLIKRATDTWVLIGDLTA